MTPTLFLPIVLGIMALGAVMRRKLTWLYCVFVVSLAFGGAAVVMAPMMGGASILVSQLAFVVLFAGVICAVPSDDLVGAARSHAPALLLAAYALIIGYFGPRLFGGNDVQVISLRVVDATMPLQPQAANITQTLYFVGSILLAWASTALFRSRLTFTDFRNAVLLLGALHATFGAIDFVASLGGSRDTFAFLRNANYGMLAQAMGGVPRAAGAFPEPSSYSSLSAPLMIFCAELWLQKRDRLAGFVALALATSIALSISSAGIFSMAVYGLILLLRLASSYRTPAMFGRLLAFLGASALVAGGLLLAAAILPGGLGGYGEAFGTMTIDKLGTTSAVERTGWAMQGVTLFADSMGFGVGAGSFRSSSFITAVLGSFGLVGILLLAVYLAMLLGRLARPDDAAVDARIAAWAALGALAPLLVVGATPDPGFVFAMFAGFALSRRDVQSTTALAPARYAG